MYLDLSKYSFLIAVEVQMCERLFECGSCTALQNYSLFSPSIFLSFSFPSLLINVWNKLLGDSGGCFWHILPSSHNSHQQAATLSKESWSCALFFHSLPHHITWCAWILGEDALGSVEMLLVFCWASFRRFFFTSTLSQPCWRNETQQLRNQSFLMKISE